MLGPKPSFLKAYEHYRRAEYSDALVECCKAFESTMKVICAKRQWTKDKKDKNATAATLVKACLENGLVPEFWQEHIAGLKNILNRASPHLGTNSEDTAQAIWGTSFRKS